MSPQSSTSIDSLGPTLPRGQTNVATALQPPVTPDIGGVDWSQRPRHLIDIGHARVPYRELGTGPDLVFVHGWPLHGGTFRRLLPLLVKDYRCHIIDLPGTTHSWWSKQTRISISGHTETLRAVIDSLELTSFAYVAHDSGGTIARWAADGDSRVVGLVLGNTEIPDCYEPALRRLILFGKAPGARLMMQIAMRSSRVRRSRWFAGGCFHDISLAQGEFEELFVEPIARSRRVASGQVSFLASFEKASVDGLRAVHSRLPCPVQLIWGEGDPFFPLGRARQMMAQLPSGSELVPIEKARLLVHEERPEAFAAAMQPFLKRCFSAQAEA